jgi:hypothetical protein
VRIVIVAALVLCIPSLAFADKSVEGNWKADLGQHDGKDVSIIMSVVADGEWASKTMQGDEPIAAMSGTYTQTTETPKKGKLVFKPDEFSNSAEHPETNVETDDYELSDDILTLKATTGGDPMVFHKQK